MLSDMRTDWHIYAAVVHENPAEKDEQTRSVWKYLSTRIPQLSKRAQAICRIPNSSADAERSFIEFKQVLSPT